MIDMGQPINFFTTSNMALEIKKMSCVNCENEYYELEGHEIFDCPVCGCDFCDERPTKESCDSESYTLIVDSKTGMPSIVKNKA
ncbi:hypothetical protein [Paenibacillus sp. F4]|uniref:hypothetical protein n=1 Tax=Paenibacillus sp. F4 TaxID=357385 RepID=UPI000C9ECF59|nr:hypothetical protein [Paenibacillus sp. F4]PNQ79675.1 hypothetical protein C1T21_16835 [Paenibacillus sp. F4]